MDLYGGAVGYVVAGKAIVSLSMLACIIESFSTAMPR